MKRKKLSLNDLAVKSFVTSFGGSNDSETIKGGAQRSQVVCSASGVCICATEDCETQVACDLTNVCTIKL